MTKPETEFRECVVFVIADHSWAQLIQSLVVLLIRSEASETLAQHIPSVQNSRINSQRNFCMR